MSVHMPIVCIMGNADATVKHWLKRSGIPLLNNSIHAAFFYKQMTIALYNCWRLRFAMISPELPKIFSFHSYIGGLCRKDSSLKIIHALHNGLRLLKMFFIGTVLFFYHEMKKVSTCKCEKITKQCYSIVNLI